MVKYCINKYPIGSFPKQKTEGRYMDGYLHENIKPLAKAIVNDMTFLGVLSSSTLEVGTGKSVIAQQIGEAYTELVNEIHKDKLEKPLEFGMQNIVFCPEDLIDRSFKLPKYSCIILDEWEDLHYWSELGTTLRQFFRKCRQLNLFMIVIIPNFFQLNMNYAIGRSIFFIDVRFGDGFERGFFKFYNFERKRDLYLQGKKEHNYNVVGANFEGRFPDGYAVPRELYLQQKHEDLARYEKLETALRGKKKDGDEMVVKIIDKYQLNKNEVSELIGKDLSTINRWFSSFRKAKGSVSMRDAEHE